jgi:putative tryptophan/tyrosine transport system substrate-binding protein
MNRFPSPAPPALSLKTRRRDLLAGVCTAILAGRAAMAQKAKILGVLAPGPLRPIAILKRRLKELGWVDGRNIRFEERWGEGDDARYVTLAAELVALPADVILTWGTPAVLAAKRATATIPIVMGTVGDPIGVGAVTSLVRPGGNVTGFSSQNYELEEKRFELLRELVPGLRRLAMLGNTGNPYSVMALKRIREVTLAAGLQFEEVTFDKAGGLEPGLQLLRQVQPDGALVAAVSALFPYRQPITDFMAANRIPAVYPFREFAEAGGLIVYATNFDDLFRQAADYVDKVLRGTSAGELPIQQAATFEIVINMRTAKAMELTIPPLLLTRADEVIE